MQRTVDVSSDTLSNIWVEGAEMEEAGYLRRRLRNVNEQLTETEYTLLEQSRPTDSRGGSNRLLRHYRDIVWALECLPSTITEELDRPMKDLDALLSLVNAEIGMDNARLENRLLSNQKSRLLLDRINEALSILCHKPGNGETLYSILRETYLIPEKFSHADIIYRLGISTRHYYRLRQQAISILSVRLWAAPGAELDAWLEVLTLLEMI